MAASGEPAPQTSSADQRAAARRRVLLAGKLVYGDADLTIPCGIRDLSESGARVRVSGPVALPQKLILVEQRTGQAFECEIAWRRLPEVGLKFLAVHDLTSGDPNERKMLKRIWLEGADRYSLP